MENIVIRRTILIILIVVFLITLSFVFESWGLLFDDISINGETQINLRIVSNVDTEDIKEIVYKASQQNVQIIDVNEGAAGTKEVVIRMEYLDTNRRQALIARLQQEYINDVELLSATSIGGSISLETRYKLFAAIGIAVAIIIVLAVLYFNARTNRTNDIES